MFGQDVAPLRSGDVQTSSLYGGTGVAPGAMQRGTDQFFDPSSVSGKPQAHAIVIPGNNDTVQLSLVNASIEAAAKAVLGDALKLNYVVADGVTGRITIQTTAPIPKDSLLDLFEASLAANGAQLKQDNGVVRIVAGTTGNTVFRVAGQGGVTASSIMVAPLKFIAATEMTKLLQPLIDQGLKVVTDRDRNLLLISGPPDLLESSLDALNLFDVDVLQGKSVALVQVHAADPDAIVGELKKIFEADQGGMLDGVIDFIPNPRLDSILVVTSRQAYLDKAQRWIRELDKTADGSAVYMATYELQNRSASEVAPIINQLLNGTAKSAAPPDATQGTDVAATSADLTSAAPGSNGSAQVFQVAADDGRNALIVRADRAGQEQIAALLRTLDSPAREVLLEATIAEVTLNDEMQLGTRWFFEKGNWGTKFTDLASGAVAGTNPGFSAVFSAGGANVALSALAGITQVRVISAPTLMVLDNKEGILQIGDQVPIATQNSTSTAGADAPVVTQIQYKDTGIILHVKPRIGSGGRILLDITQEVSSVAANTTSGIDSPTIRQRKIQTSVALGDGQTLALGGLVQENNSNSRSQTPGLGNVPVLGNLFRNKNDKKGRSELLILIRPRVVESQPDAVAATDYWRNKVSGANALLKNGLGGTEHTIYDYAK